MDISTFDYANVTGRPSGPLLRTLGRVLPGVAAVQRQVAPYAKAWHTSNVDALRGAGRRWVVLGDSMSLGIGASGPFAGWVGQLQQQLAAAGIELDVLNLSASGARVDDLLHQQLPVWRALPGGGPGDVMTVLVGSNDLMSRRHRDSMPEQFDSLLAQLPAGAVVATLPQPRAAATAANAFIETARVQRGLRVVDMRRSGPASWRGRLAADHFHPNDAGYAALAEAFLPHVRDAATAQ